MFVQVALLFPLHRVRTSDDSYFQIAVLWSLMFELYRNCFSDPSIDGLLIFSQHDVIVARLYFRKFYHTFELLSSMLMGNTDLFSVCILATIVSHNLKTVLYII